MSSVSLSSSNRLSSSHYMNPMLTQFRKRVQLKRPVQPVLPVKQQPVQQQKKNKKSVRFHEDDQVRYFLKCQSPSAVSEGDPPENAVSCNDFDLKLPNWPKRRSVYLNDGKSKIRMESLALTEADNLKSNQIFLEGRCRAMNISYEKLVSVRYTFDLWSTFEETEAIYRDSVPNYGNNTTWDRFSFYIPVTPSKKNITVYIALRYSVDHEEYWDNNDGMNYQANISPKYEVPFESDDEEEVEEVDNIVNSFNELDLKNTTTITTQQEHQQLPLKVLGRRYDFTASLNAVRKPFTSSPPLSPPGTPTDSETMPYTPPVFFGASKYYAAEQQQTPPLSPSSPSFDTFPTIPTPTTKQEPAIINDSISSPFNANDYQMSYSDFVDKYCFYNSHSNPLYNNVYSTSPSAVLS